SYSPEGTPEVECYVVPTDFRADWFVLKREDKILELQDHQRLLEEMQEDEGRNALALRLITECVHAGLPTLAFTQYVDHARQLDLALTKAGIASGLALGSAEWEEVFNETIEQLRNGQLQVGCGTFGKLGVGHDIPTIAAGVAVTPVHNNRGFLGQVKGRICRTTQGKENARIIVLWDQHVYGMAPLYNLKRWNEVCRVWCNWDKRWKDIADFIKENDNGNRFTTAAPPSQDGIFAQAEGPGGRRR
ncbi:MAG: DEAD/DEAH box helicase, partial [Halioglobus sp.]